MVCRSHRDDLLTSSQWFTEGIAMIFFHIRQICIFLAERELKGRFLIHNRLHTSIYRLKEGVKKYLYG
jgi:hypothetical protein